MLSVLQGSQVLSEDGLHTLGMSDTERGQGIEREMTGTETLQGGRMEVEGERSGCHRIIAGWEPVEVTCYTLQLSGRRLGRLIYSGSGISHLPSLFVMI